MPPEATPPVYDPAALEALREVSPDDGGAFLRELVEIFLHDTPVRLAEIAAALSAGDAPALTRAAHSIKGSAGNFGAEQLAAVSRAIEQHAKSGDLAAIPALQPEIHAAFERVRVALTPLLAPR